MVRGLVSCDGCAARSGMVVRLCVAVGQADSQGTHRQGLGTSGRCKKWVSARLRLWKVDVAMPMRPCVWKMMYRRFRGHARRFHTETSVT